MHPPFSTMTPDVPQVVVLTPSMRRLIAEAIESLILRLDEIDGDAELEDCDPAEEGTDAEPSLGVTSDVGQSLAWLATIVETDAEHDGREPGGDFEPAFVPVFDANCSALGCGSACGSSARLRPGGFPFGNGTSRSGARFA
jgi:hypothetical protein